MSVTIRLARHGTKKHAFYRIVAADKRAPRGGRFIEQVGIYDPLPDPPRIDFKKEKLHEWMRRGALPSQTVAQLIKRAGIATSGSQGGPGGEVS
jgi:small subunit ribosomal protein S16